MKRVGTILKSIFLFVTMLALLLSLTLATYAWFTTNREVSTDTVTGRTGSDTVALEISTQGGDNFQPQEEAAILQVNDTLSTWLMPVSTADLETFLYNPGTVYDETQQSSVAAYFEPVENEANYYHGRVYIRATTQDGTGTMALYLDESALSGGAIAQTEAGGLLGAARLGLTFDGEDPVIFRLTEEQNESQVRNTLINGSILSDGQVLAYANGQVQAVADPAVALRDYTITQTDATVTLPEQPLIYLEPNRIYAVDIYFYLEGCDPDCADGIAYDGADLHLAFYGLVSEEGVSA
jgi:hypothetical protein